MVIAAFDAIGKRSGDVISPGDHYAAEEAYRIAEEHPIEDSPFEAYWRNLNRSEEKQADDLAVERDSDIITRSDGIDEAAQEENLLDWGTADETIGSDEDDLSFTEESIASEISEDLFAAGTDNDLDEPDDDFFSWDSLDNTLESAEAENPIQDDYSISNVDETVPYFGNMTEPAFDISPLEQFDDALPTGFNEQDAVANIAASKEAEEVTRRGVDPDLASFTLATIYKIRGLYDHALEVLDILETKGVNPDRIASEREIIRELVQAERAATSSVPPVSRDKGFGAHGFHLR